MRHIEREDSDRHCNESTSDLSATHCECLTSGSCRPGPTTAASTAGGCSGGADRRIAWITTSTALS